MVYVVFYIHIDKPQYSEVLGVFQYKRDAIIELLERANYREKDGILTQYMKPTQEYESYRALWDKVEEEMELVDVDIYRISMLPYIRRK